MYCPQCGNQVSEGAKYCMNCGASIEGHLQPNMRGHNAQAPGPQGGRSRTPLVVALVAAAIVIVALLVLLFTNVLAQGGASTAASPSVQSASSASAAGADASGASDAQGTLDASDEGSASGEGSGAGAGAGATGDSAESAQSTVAGSTSGDALADAKEAAWAAGQQVFEGTLRVLGAETLASLQDAGAAGYAEGGEYAVLFFDSSMTVYGMSGDGSGETSRTASMLGVAEHSDYGSFTQDFGDIDSWRAYDGQTVTVAAYQQDIWFPSDVRLPLGEPTANTCEILGAR